MALRPILRWQNPDSTLDLNTASALVIDRAVFDGGQVTLSATALTLDLGPFVAHNIDGMITISDSAITLPIVPPAVGTALFHIICYARYRQFFDPILQVSLVDDATYLTSVDRSFFISFGRLSVPNTATIGTNCTLDLSFSDLASGKLGKSQLKGVVANVGALPSGTATAPLRPGDFYVVLSDNILYIWTGSAFVPNDGVANFRSHLSNREFADEEANRNTLQSGLLATAIGNYDLSSDEVATTPFIDDSAVSVSVGLRAMKLVVNGHLLETHSTKVVMPAAPPPGPDRYDLIYLEVWREQVVPPSITYETYPAPATLTTTQIEDLATQSSLTAPDSTLFPDSNYDSNTTQQSHRDPSKFLVTKYRIGTMSNSGREWITKYPQGAFIAGPSIPAPFFGGGPYLSAAGERGDANLFYSTPAVGTDDNVSWMIPILLVRRTNLEAAANYIQKFRADSGNRRFVFEVFPVANSVKAVEKAISIDTLNEDANFAADKRRRVSGFLRGIEAPIQSFGGNTITLSACDLTVMGEFFSLLSTAITLDPGSLVGVVSADSWRDTVYMRVIRTQFPDQASVSSISRSTIKPGHTSVYVQVDFVTVRTQLAFSSVENYMTAVCGLTKDPTDPGLWYGFTAATDDRISIDEVGGLQVFWAIPVAICQRRNTGAYSDTNQNGKGLRPDGHFDVDTVFPEELLDARSKVITQPSELQNILDRTLDLAIKGQLSTNFTKHPYAGAEIYGTKHLIHSQVTAALVPAGVEFVGITDGARLSWSAGDELQPVSRRINFGAATLVGLVRWDPTVVTPYLEVRAPLAGHLLTAGPEPITLERRPRFTTSYWLSTFVPSAVHGEQTSDRYNPESFSIKALVAGSDLSTVASEANIIKLFEPCIDPGGPFSDWMVTATDLTAFANPTVMRKANPPLSWNPAAGGPPGTQEIVASYWVKYPHPIAADGTHSSTYGPYNIGMGFEPDIVWSASVTTGPTVKLSVGVPISEMEFISTGIATFTITNPILVAGVPALYGVLPAGTLFYGIETVTLDDSGGGTPGTAIITKITIADDFLSGTVVLSAAPAVGQKVRIRAYVRPVTATPADFNDWVLVNPANRSVRGTFHFATQKGLKLVATLVNSRRVICVPDSGNKDAVYVPFSAAGLTPQLSVIQYQEHVPPGPEKLNSSGSVMIFHRKFATLDPWVALDSDPDPAVFGIFATLVSVQNMMSGYVDVAFNNSVVPPVDDTELMIITISQVPPPSSATIDLYYTGNMYMGSIVGAVTDASIDSRVQLLKKRVHGQVAAISDVYTTSAGGGLLTYPLSSRVFTDGVVSGSLDAPNHDGGLFTRGPYFSNPALQYQRSAAWFGTWSVRPDRANISGHPQATKLVGNVLNKLPYPGRTLNGLDDSYYSYQELRPKFVGGSSTVKGTGAVLSRDSANGNDEEGLSRLHLGDIYAYPSGWTVGQISQYEKRFFRAESLSRGISVAIPFAVPFGTVTAQLVANSWLVPGASFPGFNNLFIGAFSPDIPNQTPPPYHVESSSIGIYDAPYAQFFGVMVNPTDSDLGGRLAIMIGVNADTSSDKQLRNSSIQPRAAGGCFDVFIPFGRPLMPKVG